MDTGASPLMEGMVVIGSDMQRVGQVSSIRDTDFGVDRPLQPDVYVPFDAIAEVTDDAVVLRITAAEIDDMFWAHAGEDMDVDLSGSYD
jgi:Uncharacterized protein conserved in bacteria (DUF2171)